MAHKETSDAAREGMAQSSATITADANDEISETRQRTMTARGQEYTIETKSRTLTLLFGQLRRKFAHMEQLHESEHQISDLQHEHHSWLTLYEEFLQDYQSLCVYLSEEDNLFEDKLSLLAMFKKTIETWFVQDIKREGSVKPDDSASQISVQQKATSRLSRVSSRASVSSIRLKEQQRRAELSAKLDSLNSKHTLQMAKLNLQLEEEQLNIKTELNIVDAKTKALDQFEQNEIQLKGDMLSAPHSQISYPKGKTEHGINRSWDIISKPLNPTAQTFIPDNTHTNYGNKYDHNSPNISNVPPAYPLNPDFIGLQPRPINQPGPATTDNDVITSVVRQLRKPAVEIKCFGGDPLEYHRFIRQFKTKIVMNSDSEQECFNYLEQYTVGEAYKIVNGFTSLDSTIGYAGALKELHERYGEEEVLANAYVKKALNWPFVKADSPKSLDEFAIFMSECNCAIQSIDAVKILQYPENMRKLVSKLPFHYHDKWRSLVHNLKQKSKVVQFSDLAHFVKTEAKKACDPTYGKEAFHYNYKPTHVKGQKIDTNHWSKSAIKGSFATSLDQASTNTRSTSDVIPQSDKKCIHCNETSHSVDSCHLLSKLPYQDRIDFLKPKGLCFGCLKPGHRNKTCRSRSTCSICNYRHPSVLHDENWTKRRKETTMEDKTAIKENKSSSFSSMSKVCGITGAGDGECTMAVIPVRAKLKDSLCSVVTYAFLDPGSNVSFCSEQLLSKLGGTGQRLHMKLDTMGESQVLETSAVKNLQIGDLNLDNVIDLPRVYTKASIPISKDHIPRSQDIADWPHLKDVVLPQVDCEIGLLIGNNIPDVYTPLQLRTGPRGSPHATKSLLGWIVWNVIRNDNSPNQQNLQLSVNKAELSALNEEDVKYRELDKLVRHSINLEFPERVVDDRKQHSQEDKLFLNHVEKSIELHDGHYYIDLPLKREDTYLPDNKSQALRRLKHLKHKMKNNLVFGQDYKDFMGQLLENGYAEEINKEDLIGTSGRVWYIPHHGVYHPRKPGKLRVVFDCSASYQGSSLNDVLLQGPDLTNSLLGVLLRFRQDSVAIMGDIEAMYHQVRVPSKDRDFLRFYWWPNGNLDDTPKQYRMRVHLFGSVSSPSCASFALRHTAVDNMELFDTFVTNGLNKNFYVDDYLTSTDSEEKAIKLIEDTRTLCKQAGFRLTKWISNSHTVLETSPSAERSKEIKLIDLKQDQLPPERALGVYWVTESDKLGFKICDRQVPCTRRGILSLSSSIYDPLGITAPYLLIPKCILQDLCRTKTGGDEQIDDKNTKKWNEWISDLKTLESLLLERCYKPKDFKNITSCELHHFSDASDTGYGMISYIRSTDASGKIHCSFVIGKARVAPLKKITIPRMELTAATNLVRLNSLLLRELDIKIDESYYWTDSSSVLKHIANETSRFHTFVANRINVIREASETSQWRYVNTHINPADCASRGLSMDSFLKAKHWFYGPEFLWHPKNTWPEPVTLDNNLEGDPEVKTVNLTVCPPQHALDQVLERFSGLLKVRKVVAWLLVAKRNLKRHVAQQKLLDPDSPNNQQIRSSRLQNNKDVFKQSLNLEDLKEADKVLIQFTQEKYFSKEIGILQNSDSSTKSITKASKLFKLDPFLSDGIIHVGGRLERSDIPLNAKFPIVLPKDSPLSTLILRDAHERVGHLGKNTTLAQVRQFYWIIGANSSIKSILSKCVTCKRYQSPTTTQKMANLPSDRVTPNEPPFSQVGVDYFGPFEIKRARSVVKRYGVVFTCLASRAVHLEVAASLDTDSCINAIRRFTARRGPVRLIRSDNGTNFIGAERELREELSKMNAQKLKGALLKYDISWEFNPPTASHFGGVWERMIRLVRKIMYSVLRSQTLRLDDEGLQTLFCEIEGILNGRPLTETPNSPNDLDVLTPNHLLLFRSGETLPPGDFQKEDCYSKRRWRQIQYLADLFWKRWVKEYLPLLQQRQKWNVVRKNLSVGDIVLAMDNSRRNCWSLGRVLEIFKDKKGLVRIVRIQTRSATLLRPVSKLCLLLEAL